MTSTRPSLLWRLTDWWSTITGGAASGPKPSNDTLEGFKANLRREIMKADRDGDGRISVEEWQVWRRQHPFAADFSRFDVNEDGYITPDDIDAIAARRFAFRQRVASGETRAGVRGAKRGSKNTDGPAKG